jgi:Domain of unknown function (DUF5658)
MRVCLVPGRRVFVPCLIAFGIFAGTPVGAQERPESPTPGFAAAIAAPKLAEQVSLPPAAMEPKRPSALVPLYVSLVGLQALDIHSTRRGMSSGTTRESNPVMKSFVNNDATFIAVKASVTAGTIFATEKLRKTRPKTAVVLAAALNIGMAAVVVNNYRVSRAQ